MNSAEQVIQKFGGQTVLATHLGKRQSTVQHWAKTGIIPAQWHQRLLSLAIYYGITLDARELIYLPEGQGPPIQLNGTSTYHDGHRHAWLKMLRLCLAELQVPRGIGEIYDYEG